MNTAKKKGKINKLEIYWLLLMATISGNRGHGLCDQQPRDKLFCSRMFPTKILKRQDLRVPKPLPDTNCNYIQFGNLLTITGVNDGFNTLIDIKCDSVPSNTTDHSFGHTTLQVNNIAIDKTNITTLKKGAFSTWTGVEVIQICMNYNLERIEPGAFENLTNVWNLTISDNLKLRIIEENTFSGLINLKQLRYLRNDLKKISHLSVALGHNFLPNLTVLFIMSNDIKRVNKDDFKTMENSKLSTLKISLSKTDWIHEEAFDPLGPLEDLILTRNNLQSSALTPLLKHIMDRHPSTLRQLNLKYNVLGVEIKPLLEILAQNNSAVSYLNLRNNHFGILNPGFFPKMPSLERLDLSNVMIEDLPEGVISKELMPNLERLYLEGNLLSGLKPSMVSETLKVLDISNNGNNFPGSLEFNIDPRAFDRMPKLKSLNLSGNKLNVFYKDTLNNVTELEFLDLKNSYINIIQEGAFSTNKKIFFLDLSYNNFPIVNDFTKEIFQGLDNLIALDLSNCRISDIKHSDVFFYLKSLQYLSLRKNTILNLSPNIFQWMPNLYAINIRCNIMVSWNERMFQNNKRLNYTLLDYNHIQNVTDAMMDDFLESKVVTLYSNPLVCDCTLVTAVNKAIQKGRIADVKKLPFSDSKNTCINKQGETLINFLSKVKPDQCKNKQWITILSATLGTLALTSIVGYVIYYYYKYDIHFWFLKTKRRLGLLHYIGSKKTDKPDDFKYDAFVSYCIVDEKFVEKMVYILEKEKFNLCIFERDFNVGDVLTDRIVRCIDTSRNTILVLTESFAKSQWCCWEMDVAQSRSILLRDPDSNDSLVIIKKSEIPESLMTPTLRHLMNNRVYLEWHSSPIRQKIFWEQLKNTLNKKKVT